MSDSEVYFGQARTVGINPASAAIAVLRTVDSVVYPLHGVIVYQAECRACIEYRGVVPVPVRLPVYRVRRRTDLPET